MPLLTIQKYAKNTNIFCINKTRAWQQSASDLSISISNISGGATHHIVKFHGNMWNPHHISDRIVQAGQKLNTCRNMHGLKARVNLELLQFTSSLNKFHWNVCTSVNVRKAFGNLTLIFSKVKPSLSLEGIFSLHIKLKLFEYLL